MYIIVVKYYFNKTSIPEKALQCKHDIYILLYSALLYNSYTFPSNTLSVVDFQIDILVFASSDDSTARKALYKLEAAKIATKYNYLDITRSKDIEEMGYGGDVIFGIYKTDKILQSVLSEY